MKLELVFKLVFEVTNNKKKREISKFSGHNSNRKVINFAESIPDGALKKFDESDFFFMSTRHFCCFNMFL